MRPGSSIRSVMYELRSRATARPELQGLLGLTAGFPRGRRLVNLARETVLVVDGFQGSSNSLFFVTFQETQPQPVPLGGHIHSPGQIVRAVRQGVPTLVLIRQPVAAVASLVSRWPYIGLRQGMAAYVRFYSRIEPFSDGYVVATFEDVVSDPGAVVERINRRFSTVFSVPQTPSSRATPRDAASPREARKRAALSALDQLPSLEPLRYRADQLFQRFQSLRDQSRGMGEW